jgi:hypothetical protein
VYCLCSILAEIGEEDEKAKAKKQLKQPLTRAPTAVTKQPKSRKQPAQKQQRRQQQQQQQQQLHVPELLGVFRANAPVAAMRLKPNGALVPMIMPKGVCLVAYQSVVGPAGGRWIRIKGSGLWVGQRQPCGLEQFTKLSVDEGAVRYKLIVPDSGPMSGPVRGYVHPNQHSTNRRGGDVIQPGSVFTFVRVLENNAWVWLQSPRGWWYPVLRFWNKPQSVQFRRVG